MSIELQINVSELWRDEASVMLMQSPIGTDVNMIALAKAITVDLTSVFKDHPIAYQVHEVWHGNDAISRPDVLFQNVDRVVRMNLLAKRRSSRRLHIEPERSPWARLPWPVQDHFGETKNDGH